MTTILNPSFEDGGGGINNWVPVESSGAGASLGVQSIWKTQGSYGSTITSGNPSPYYAYMTQVINFDSLFDLVIDFKFTSSTAGVKARVLIDNTVIYELAADSAEHLNISIPISSYFGNHTLKLGISGAAGETMYFDNYRIQNEITYLNDVYVNSSTGSDSNAGDSCTAGHPLLTFGKTYSLLTSGGTIHVCNSGADFSGETVTLNKSFSIDLNGSSGNFYGPKAS